MNSAVCKRLVSAPAMFAATLLCSTGMAYAEEPVVAVPAGLAVAGEAAVLRVAAVGTQIYECRQVEGKPAAWAFVAPDADLFDAKTLKRIGRHYAGPTWELDDGSKVTGAVKARADSVAPGAIPQLLLTAKSTGGAGDLEKVTSVQRLDTVGGIALGSGCSTAGDVGKKVGVYYSANYVFLAPVNLPPVKY